MKKALLGGLFALSLVAILLLQNQPVVTQKFSYKSKAAEPAAIAWDKTQSLNYLMVEVDTINQTRDEAILKEHLPWALNSFQFDIRDPDYRLYFLKITKAALKDSGKKGLIFVGLFNCPLLSSAVCPSWREMAMKDFLAQARQYFSETTLLYQAPLEIDPNKKELYAHYLLQLDGVMVKADQKEALSETLQAFVPKNILTKKLILTY